MKTLTLIRHAKSDWSDPARSDFDQPLNKRGKKAAPLIGSRMAEDAIIPDLIISSPAKRARKTALLIADEISYDRDLITYDETIYEAWLETLIDLTRQLPETDHIALVGHNPGMTELAEWLDPKAPEWLPTCAVLTLSLGINDWTAAIQNCGHITRYDFPKKTSA